MAAGGPVVKSPGRRLAPVVLLAIGALVLVLLTVRSSIASLHRAHGSSDAPTIRDGDVFIVNRLAYDLRLPLTGHRLARLADPQRGDMVLFLVPISGHLATKRVVAIPGDLVEVRAGRLVVNGLPARYRSVGSSAPQDPSTIFLEEWNGLRHFVTCPSHVPPTDAASVTAVPVGHYFLLGDNRESLDSRDFGPVPRDAIQGRVAIASRSGDGR